MAVKKMKASNRMSLYDVNGTTNTTKHNVVD